MDENKRSLIDSVSISDPSISRKSLLTMKLFETINNAHIKIAGKLGWDDPNDPEWRLELANAIDEVLKDTE